MMRTIPLCLLVVACSNSHSGVDPRDGDVPPGDGAVVPTTDGEPGITDGRVATDGGSPERDGTTPERDSAAPRDAGAGVAGRIVCGTTECDATTQGCLASCLYATDERMPACVALDPDGRWPAAECPSGREMFPRYWLTCDGAEDCAAGERCHVLYGSLGQYAQCATCEPPCDFRYFEQLCRSDAECTADAPVCAPNPNLPGYSTCQVAS